MIGEASGKTPGALFCLILSLMLMLAFMPYGNVQVVHENPADSGSLPPMDLDIQMNNALGITVTNLDDISFSMLALNFTGAKLTFSDFDQTFNKYKYLLWQLNLSESDYNAILSKMDFSRDSLGTLINESENYTKNRDSYVEAVSKGDSTDAGIYAAVVTRNFGNVLTSYDSLRSNATVANSFIGNTSIDPWYIENSMDNFNNYIKWIINDYNKLGIEQNNQNNITLQLSADRNEARIGEDVTFFVVLSTDNGKRIKGSGINLYMNNSLIGKLSTDMTGSGSMVYTIPVKIASDHVVVHAEFAPEDIRVWRTFSNDVELNITDEVTGLSANVEPNEAVYGDTVKISGLLASSRGIPAPEKLVNIYMNGASIGSVMTGDDGSYAYDLSVTQHTPDGSNTIYSEYTRKPGDVFLGSRSHDEVLTVQALKTTLTLHSDNASYALGDTAYISGSLVAENGLPVGGENVLIYIDDAVWYNARTGPDGTYSAGLFIPYNAKPGSHKIYASYDPGSGKSLRSSSSDSINVTFLDTGEVMKLSGLPLILFKGDSLNMSGSLYTGEGKPIKGWEVTASLSNTTIDKVRTDARGLFNLLYTVSGNESMGMSAISVSDASSGSPSPAVYSAQVLIVPYDKLLLIAILVLVVALILIIAYMVRLRRGRAIGSEVSREAIAPQAPVAEEPMAAAAPEIIKPEETIRLEIDAIKSAIKEGNIPDAVKRIYTASRRAAIEHGINVPDSMTHNEFYAAMTLNYPSLYTPLGSIIRMYEKVNYGRRDASGHELDLAINSLREIFAGLEAEKGAR